MKKLTRNRIGLVTFLWALPMKLQQKHLEENNSLYHFSLFVPFWLRKFSHRFSLLILEVLSSLVIVIVRESFLRDFVNSMAHKKVKEGKIIWWSLNGTAEGKAPWSLWCLLFIIRLSVENLDGKCNSRFDLSFILNFKDLYETRKVNWIYIFNIFNRLIYFFFQ